MQIVWCRLYNFHIRLSSPQITTLHHSGNQHYDSEEYGEVVGHSFIPLLTNS